MRLLARLLLWIMIVALPLQGGATTLVASGSWTAPGQAIKHHVADSPAATHADHCAKAAADPVNVPHGKCSHCASCCVGAAAPPSVPSLSMPTLCATIAESAIEPAMTAYIPATLERPPRCLS